MFGILTYVWDFGICLGFWNMFGISAYVWDFGINFGFGISALVSADIWRKPKYFGTKQMSFGTQV
jgi:hypothetical protein